MRVERRMEQSTDEGRGPVRQFLLPFLNNCLCTEMFASNPSLLGLLNALTGTYKYSLAFLKGSLLSSPSTLEAVVFIHPLHPGMGASLLVCLQDRGVDSGPRVTGFLLPWGLDRCIHPSRSLQQME